MKFNKTGKLLLILAILLLKINITADGFIVIRPTYPRRIISRAFPLEVKYHTVKVEIKDLVATTKIDQVFYNPYNRRLEGYYLFPVPQGAVLKNFSMFVNGKELIAELLNAKKARKIYEDIVRKQRDPALLEYIKTGVFKVRIFPIEPYSKKRIKISYHEILKIDNNLIEYLYPLNTEKFSAKPLNNVSVSVTIDSLDEIKSIFCPTHKTEIIRKGKHRALITYEDRNVKPDTDFKLYFNKPKKQMGISFLNYGEGIEEGFFFLNINPGYKDQRKEIVKKDIVFVMDVSGSMAGEKLRQAKRALLFCIENLNKGDRFEIIRFSTEAEALFNKMVRVDNKYLDKARDFIKNLAAIGGTNISEALNMALNNEQRRNIPFYIVFLTDGKPTIGVTTESGILQGIKGENKNKAKIFTFGIGNDINTHLLDKITEITKAYRTYISPAEDIEIKLSNFYTKIQYPVLTNIKLKFAGDVKVSKIYPKSIPDLFWGSSLTFLGKYKGSGKVKLTIRGKMGKKEQEYFFYQDFREKNQKNDFIPSLWAARRVGYLLDQIRLHGKSREVVNEITYLARKYGIVTPYTSFLIIEDERRQVRGRNFPQEHQTLGRIADYDREFEKKNRAEFSDLKRKSGNVSVRTSKEFQSMNQATNSQQALPGKGRVQYKFWDKTKKQGFQVQLQVKNIQGRANYYTGKYWVDSDIQRKKTAKKIRIQFASREYFVLLNKKPKAAEFLALGKNLLFTLDDILYEIYE